MRLLEKKMVSAFNGMYNWNGNNTSVVSDGKESRVYLHGNLIAINKDGKKSFSNAGWFSNTTKSRLNALGLGVCQKNYKWFVKGQEWKGEFMSV